MDCRLKPKNRNYKTFVGKCWRKDFELGKDFYNTTKNSQAKKEKINKLYFIKIKNSVHPKDTISTKQATD